MGSGTLVIMESPREENRGKKGEPHLESFKPKGEEFREILGGLALH